MIAWARHSKTPEISLQNEVRELTPELPPMLPKVAPVVRGRLTQRGWSCRLLGSRRCQKEAFSGRPLVTEQLKFGALAYIKPTGVLRCKSAVCGLNGQRVYFLIALSLVTYGNAI
jgi:hypothetical protein